MATETGRYINQNAILVEKQREMAKTFGLPIKDIQDICNLPFTFLKETIESQRPLDRYFPSFKIPGFMTWYVPDARQYMSREAAKAYLEREKLKEEEVNNS